MSISSASINLFEEVKVVPWYEVLTGVFLYGFGCDGGGGGDDVGLGGSVGNVVVFVGWMFDEGLIEKDGPACILLSLCPS